MDKRYGKAKWGPGQPRNRTSVANWRKPLQWNKQAQALGERHRVFCASLSDVFEDHPDWLQPRGDLLAMITATPNLDWLLLTKRPENINRMIERATGFSDSEMWFCTARNVWIGTSVENQEQADKRIPELMKIPAPVRFLSMEPLLGPVTFDEEWEKFLDWVIVGGESGAKARPMQITWAQFIEYQCRQAGIAFFMKQLGGNPDKRHNIDDFPPELRVREFPQ